MPSVVCEADFQSFGDAEMGEVGMATIPRGMPKLRSPQEQRCRTCISAGVVQFEELVRGAKMSGGEIVDVQVEDFLRCHEVWAESLSKVKTGLGAYITMNTKCIREMKEIDWSKKNYSEFLFSELKLHVNHKKDDYVVDSAWNSSRWIAYVNELFVVYFQGTVEGKETKVALADAYKETLMHHHTFVMKKVFLAGASAVPVREKMIDLIKGPEGTEEHIWEDLEVFGRVAPLVLRYIYRLDRECQALLAQHKPKK